MPKKKPFIIKTAYPTFEQVARIMGVDSKVARARVAYVGEIIEAEGDHKAGLHSPKTLEANRTVLNRERRKLQKCSYCRPNRGENKTDNKKYGVKKPKSRRKRGGKREP